MDAVTIRMTNAEYMAMPDDGRRYEIYDGLLIEKPSYTMLQSWTVTLVGAPLGEHVRGKNNGYAFLSGLDYFIAEGHVFKPSASFIVKERVPDLNGWPQGAPEIAVEVIAPHITASDILYKIPVYLRYGSKIVWIVDPYRNRVQVCQPYGDTARISRTLTIDDTLTGETVLPDFRLPLHEVFDEETRWEGRHSPPNPPAQP